MSKIKAVLFDLGNTLFKLGKQEDWDWVGIHKEGMEKVGFNIDVDRLRQAILNIPEETLTKKKVLYGEIYRFHKEIIKYILESLGYKDLTDHKLHLATMSARQVIINVQSLSDDALPCLEKLTQKGMMVGVITNAEGQTAINSERMGLARYIDFIIDSAHVGVRKPDEMIFKIAINTLQRNCENPLQPGEIMYVGNELEEDALAAKAVGLTGVWLNRDDKRVDPRVPTIHSLHDLEKLIL
ncbi:MAG: Pyrimidine 5'-nucleotidase YjjG [Candidatus Scalindua rubra]|uniref:Pyrimidine 5'-nucleotidase YjjG n=1 Tax=Candidatus Scalindua rubra TaxID=1872076 RepID=A0A1E3XG84_9BACT|nr:MAG: Pyrimidine 5'-nucleotidase YjjG [Candidatus Scalindua rubra]